MAYDFDYTPPEWAIDEQYQMLVPYVNRTEEGFCYHIENLDEESVAEDCGFKTQEAAEDAADEARYYIAELLAREECDD